MKRDGSRQNRKERRGSFLILLSGVSLILAGVFLAGITAVGDGEESRSVSVGESEATSAGSKEISVSLGTTETEEPKETQAKSDAQTSLPQQDSSADEKITLVMVGDMLMHDPVVSSGLQEDGTYDFSHLFAHVSDRIASADLSVLNQETIMGGDELGIFGYPCFNTPRALADAEASVGFDVILHGTNHVLDMGSGALLSCIDYWESFYPQIAYLGINKSQEHRDEYLFIYEKDGIRVAVLNYTYGTNGSDPPADQSYLVNYLNQGEVQADIARAKEEADFVVVCPHWGTEYQFTADAYQQKWTQIFLDAGVDLVIGTHPHVLEPVEWVSDGEGQKMLVYYSLGNFVNGTSSEGTGVTDRMVGGMASVVIGREEDGTVGILDYEAIPLVCHMAEGTDFTVYYLDEYTEELADENLIRSQDSGFSLQRCRQVLLNVPGWQ